MVSKEVVRNNWRDYFDNSNFRCYREAEQRCLEKGKDVGVGRNAEGNKEN